MLQHIVGEVIERLKNGRTSVQHKEGARRPSTSITDAKMEQVHDVNLQNRSVTIDEMALQLPISYGSPYETIHNRLAFHKVYTQWVPKQLKELHKQKHLDVFKWLLDRYGAEGENFPERIVIGDETWIQHYEPDSKCQSMDCKHPHLPARRRLKTHPNTRQFTPTVFGDSQGLLLKHYQEGSTVNSARYSEMLRDKLKAALQSEQHVPLSEGDVLLPNYARPHTAAYTIETLKKLNSEILEHSPYSPDIAPSGYHLFGPFKQA
jgi:histone-lysine N-methyltransferase SETMAR